MDAIQEAVDQAKAEAERLERLAEELKTKAQAEAAEARARAIAEKEALDADLDWQVSQLKDYTEKRKAEIDHRYGLE